MSDDYWPKGEGYKTPAPEPELNPLCPRCGARHLDPLPWCARTNLKDKTHGRRPD